MCWMHLACGTLALIPLEETNECEHTRTHEHTAPLATKPPQNAVGTRPSPGGPNSALREDLELKLCGECSGPRIVHSGPRFRAKTIRLQKVRGSGLPSERGHRQTDRQAEPFLEFRSVEPLFGLSPLGEKKGFAVCKSYAHRIALRCTPLHQASLPQRVKLLVVSC